MPFYAVHVGRQTGVFNTWAEAEQQVKGFAGAQFKKFDSVGDAEFFADRGRQAASASAASPYSRDRASEQRGSSYQYSSLDTLVVRRPAASSSSASASVGAKSLSDPGRTVVYCDGSAMGNGRSGARAGIGVYFGTNDARNVSEPLGAGAQTNQRAELAAAARALKASNPKEPIEIRTDSTYTIKCATEWLPKWQRNGFKTSGNTDVKNRDLVEELGALAKGRDIVWTHVRGHQGEEGNEFADRLAVAGAQQSKN